MAKAIVKFICLNCGKGRNVETLNPKYNCCGLCARHAYDRIAKARIEVENTLRTALNIQGPPPGWWTVEMNGQVWCNRSQSWQIDERIDALVWLIGGGVRYA